MVTQLAQSPRPLIRIEGFLQLAQRPKAVPLPRAHLAPVAQEWQWV